MKLQQQEHPVVVGRRNPSRTKSTLQNTHPQIRQLMSKNLFARIYTLTRQIPRGRVATYGQIAQALGLPRGARTVGWAMHDCPDDVPWHRVVNAQGKISARPTLGFIAQRARLKTEGVRFDRAGKIDLKEFGWNKL